MLQIYQRLQQMPYQDKMQEFSELLVSAF